MIKTFQCGLCQQKNKEFKSTRAGLRKHLRDEHRILSEITNHVVKGKYKKQSWWIEK